VEQERDDGGEEKRCERVADDAETLEEGPVGAVRIETTRSTCEMYAHFPAQQLGVDCHHCRADGDERDDEGEDLEGLVLGRLSV
jgi:hypothetical protein